MRDGEAVYEGRVELCHSGVWGTISDHRHHWSAQESMVVCRQLGYKFKGMINKLHTLVIIAFFSLRNKVVTGVMVITHYLKLEMDQYGWIMCGALGMRTDCYTVHTTTALTTATNMMWDFHAAPVSY